MTFKFEINDPILEDFIHIVKEEFEDRPNHHHRDCHGFVDCVMKLGVSYIAEFLFGDCF